MGAQFTDVTVHEQVVVRAAVTSADPVDMASSNFAFEPRIIEATYRREDDGPWARESVMVSGPRVRKDGSTGEIWHDRTFRFRWTQEKPPKWIVAFVDAHDPANAEGV